MPKLGTLPEEPKAPEPPDPNGAVLMAFEVGDTIYELRDGSWSWQDENELYSITGLGYPRIRVEIVTGNASAFLIGCLVFLAERGLGNEISFDDAQAKVQQTTSVDLKADSVKKKLAKKDPGPKRPSEILIEDLPRLTHFYGIDDEWLDSRPLNLINQYLKQLPSLPVGGGPSHERR